MMLLTLTLYIEIQPIVKQYYVLMPEASYSDTVKFVNESYQLKLDFTGKVKECNNSLYYLFDSMYNQEEFVYIINELKLNNSKYYLKENDEVYNSINLNYLKQNSSIHFIEEEITNLFFNTDYYNTSQISEKERKVNISCNLKHINTTVRLFLNYSCDISIEYNKNEYLCIIDKNSSKYVEILKNKNIVLNECTIDDDYQIFVQYTNRKSQLSTIYHYIEFEIIIIVNEFLLYIILLRSDLEKINVLAYDDIWEYLSYCYQIFTKKLSNDEIMIFLFAAYLMLFCFQKLYNTLASILTFSIYLGIKVSVIRKSKKNHSKLEVDDVQENNVVILPDKKEETALEYIEEDYDPSVHLLYNV